MKKSLLFLASAALVLAACNNDVMLDENKNVGASNQPQEISFSPYSHTAKRVKSNAPVQSAVFPATYTMEIAAYKSSATAGSYFSKMTYKKDATEDYWRGWDGSAYAPQYWPMGPETLNFFAVSADGVTNTHITIENDLSAASVALTKANGYSETTQSDVMYAFNRGSVTLTDHALSFNGNAPVNMVFSHAMALINFQIKAGNSASTAIAIKKIELNGAYYTGTLAFANENAATLEDAFDTELNWTTTGTDVVVNNVLVPHIGNVSSPVALTADYVPANNTTTSSEGNAWAALIVIPSDQKASDPVSRGFTSFTITYTHLGKEYSYTYAPAGWSDHDSNPETPEVANLTPVEAGKKYTYQITMTLHEITVAPSVTQWDEQNSADNVNI